MPESVKDLKQDGMTEAAVEDVGVRHAAPDGGEAGLHLGDHARGQGRKQLLQVIGVELAGSPHRVRPVRLEPLDVGEHDQLGRAERDGQAAAAVSAFTL